jgi:hypothetical protein
MAKKDTELITLDWYKRAQKIRSYQLPCDFQVFVRYMSELRFLLGSDRLNISSMALTLSNKSNTTKPNNKSRSTPSNTLATYHPIFGTSTSAAIKSVRNGSKTAKTEH